MALRNLGRRFESVSNLLSIGGRRLLGLDTNPVPADWTHVTKIDPEVEKPIPLCYPLYLSHTSAVSVGGSRGVTAANTEETFEFLSPIDTPAFHEPSGARQVTKETSEAMDFLAVPEVLNGDSEALIGTLGEGLDYVRTELGPELLDDRIGVSLGGFLEGRTSDAIAAYLMHDAVFEAYIIMNPESAAAREANVSDEDLLSPDAARKRALAAEYHLESEIVYLEYSGTFGGEEAEAILDELTDAVQWGRIWYGGGLDSREAVKQVHAAGAEAVVVGDVFHDIAELEVEIIEQAQDHFSEPATLPELQSWVGEEVDLAETPAARYLSTVLEVSDPIDQATKYLATAVWFGLAIEEIADGLDDPNTATLERAVRDWPPTEDDAVAGTVSESAIDIPRPIGRRLALGLLAERFDVDVAEAFNPDHLAVSV